MLDIPPDITSELHDGETWNTCPRCGKSWKDNIPVPQVIHRTRHCDTCKNKLIMELDNFLKDN